MALGKVVPPPQRLTFQDHLSYNVFGGGLASIAEKPKIKFLNKKRKLKIKKLPTASLETGGPAPTASGIGLGGWTKGYSKGWAFGTAKESQFDTYAEALAKHRANPGIAKAITKSKLGTRFGTGGKWKYSLRKSGTISIPRGEYSAAREETTQFL